MANLLEVKDKVQRHLVEFVGNINLLPDGRFAFDFESTRLFVLVSQSESGESTFILLSAPIAFEVPKSPALFEWLAQQSGEYLLGHIECLAGDADSTVRLRFAHTLLGDFLDAEELRRAVIAVVQTANDLDEKVVAGYGGKRFADT